MGKDDCDELDLRRRRRPGRPLLTAATATGMVSLMAGCPMGNLMSPPSHEVCFRLEPPTAEVAHVYTGTSYTDAVYLDDQGCGLVFEHEYPQLLQVSAPGHCTYETSLDDVLAGLQTFTLGPCPGQNAVPDQGVASDQGLADAGQDASVNDAGEADLGPDADLEDGG